MITQRVTRPPDYRAGRNFWGSGIPLPGLKSVGCSIAPRTPYTGQHDTIADFEKRQVVLLEVEKTVYVAGAGPAVIVMPETPGISPELMRFARWVREAGFKVFVPSLFGTDGAVASAADGVEIYKKLCVSAEFSALKRGRSSPVTNWLRALARQAHGECGGPGIGAIGMCFTGNFALSMMLEPSMLAPVVAQPSLPMNDPDGVELGDEELSKICARMRRENLTVLAYRFSNDPYCRTERFQTYKNALGENFVERVLPADCGNPVTPPFFATYVKEPHSVFTAHLVDEEGHPTLQARDEVLRFFKRRLIEEHP